MVYIYLGLNSSTPLFCIESGLSCRRKHRTKSVNNVNQKKIEAGIITEILSHFKRRGNGSTGLIYDTNVRRHPTREDVLLGRVDKMFDN